LLGSDPRLEALRTYNLLDTPPEQAFDDLVEAASAFCMTPIALVSLVDADRQWFKACLGLNVRQTPVDQAVCAIAILQPTPLIIPDLALDPRTAGNPLVFAGPCIRFYAGAPLVTKAGHALGTLCVIDTKPRPDGLTVEQIRGLSALARQVTTLIELRTAIELRDTDIISRVAAEPPSQTLPDDHQAAQNRPEPQGVRSIAAQEAGRIGTFDLNLTTDIAVVSPVFCQLFGLPEMPSYSFRAIETIMVSTDNYPHASQIERRSGTAPLDVEYRIRRPSDGQVRWIARRAQFEFSGQTPVHMYGTVQDVTLGRQTAMRVSAMLELGDKLRAAQSLEDILLAASTILGRELEADRAGYATFDAIISQVKVEQDWSAPGHASLVGSYPLSAFADTINHLKSDQPMVVSDITEVSALQGDLVGYQAIGLKAVINVPLVVQGKLKGIIFVHQARPRLWSEQDVEFASGVADRTYAAVAYFDAQKQRAILNQELSHRMKNMLTMVQAIASQTLKNVRERSGVQAFNDRLVALSTAHDVLLQDNWDSAPIRSVVSQVLYTLAVKERTEIHGPDLHLGPKATLSLSLLLHEMATNAVKHGALSVPCGHLRVFWTQSDAGGEEMFTLHWIEIDGPPAVQPEIKGFGSRLIRLGVLGTGGATLRYLPTGLEAEFTASLERARAD